MTMDDDWKDKSLTEKMSDAFWKFWRRTANYLQAMESWFAGRAMLSTIDSLNNSYLDWHHIQWAVTAAISEVVKSSVAEVKWTQLLVDAIRETAAWEYDEESMWLDIWNEFRKEVMENLWGFERYYARSLWDNMKWNSTPVWAYDHLSILFGTEFNMVRASEDKVKRAADAVLLTEDSMERFNNEILNNQTFVKTIGAFFSDKEKRKSYWKWSEDRDPEEWLEGVEEILKSFDGMWLWEMNQAWSVPPLGLISSDMTVQADFAAEQAKRIMYDSPYAGNKVASMFSDFDEAWLLDQKSFDDKAIYDPVSLITNVIMKQRSTPKEIQRLEAYITQDTAWAKGKMAKEMAFNYINHKVPWAWRIVLSLIAQKLRENKAVEVMAKNGNHEYPSEKNMNESERFEANKYIYETMWPLLQWVDYADYNGLMKDVVNKSESLQDNKKVFEGNGDLKYAVQEAYKTYLHSVNHYIRYGTTEGIHYNEKAIGGVKNILKINPPLGMWMIAKIADDIQWLPNFKQETKDSMVAWYWSQWIGIFADNIIKR